MGDQINPANDEILEGLRRGLKSDPTNLLLANLYWQALSNVNGYDARTGRYLIEAFRGAALHSCEGVLALARAWRELFEVSGEGPRAAYFDQELIQTLRTCESKLREDERSAVTWVLDQLEA